MTEGAPTCPARATYFARAERATPDALTRSVEVATTHPVMNAVLETLGGIVALLNPERQIVAVNQQLLAALGASDPTAVLGLRPGEALSCVHAAEAPSGCGTGRPCATCGAAIAIVSSAAASEPVERECLLTVRRQGHEEPLELLARARRIELESLPFTMVVLHDIRDQKRRETLERAFFHDILNTVGSLRTYGELLAEGDPVERNELLHEMGGLLERVVREVESHRDLALAERGEYPVHPSEVGARDVLEDLRVTFAHHDAVAGKTLATADSDVTLFTDATLLHRVLTNMVKNALEATPPGGTVRAWCAAEDGTVSFHVHNAGVIPEPVALRIFQRSFSTKHGAGRGMGTYGMKLFGERCLQGRVGFATGPDTGTVFTLTLPRR